MLVATQGLVLHTTPYSESSVVAKVFTRQMGVRSYIVKGVRGRSARVKQNLLQPLTSLDMVVYDNHHNELNHIKELSPRHPQQPSEPIANALRFFMTEVLYKTLREEEPMQELWDYVESAECGLEMKNEDLISSFHTPQSSLPIVFMLKVAHYMGIAPMDNHSAQTPYFCLEEGRFVGTQNDTSLSASLSTTLHNYLQSYNSDVDTPHATLRERTDLVNALIAYFQMHLSGFRNFTSHEILHSVLR